MSSDGPGDSSTTTRSFTIPLRPLIEKHDRPDTLPVEIAQINAQWGSFRGVNEDELRAKIQEEKDKEGLEDDEGEEEEGGKPAGEVDSTERSEQLYKRRAEITQFALYVSRVLTLVIMDDTNAMSVKHKWKQCSLSILSPFSSRNTPPVKPKPRCQLSSSKLCLLDR